MRMSLKAVLKSRVYRRPDGSRRRIDRVPPLFLADRRRSDLLLVSVTACRIIRNKDTFFCRCNGRSSQSAPYVKCSPSFGGGALCVIGCQSSVSVAAQNVRREGNLLHLLDQTEGEAHLAGRIRRVMGDRHVKHQHISMPVGVRIGRPAPIRSFKAITIKYSA